jgi:pimeloyl-ACP methyl ester carboxylesterase
MEWELIESGPRDAAQTVLLLPGGACAAGMWREVMAEPALGGVRCVAATLPGNAGAPAPDDFSVAALARLVTELADKVGADVIAGFSMGSTAALVSTADGLSKRPVVLTGISISPEAEPAVFRAIVRLGSVLGTLPARLLRAVMPSIAKKATVPPERQAELAADFRRNKPGDMRRVLTGYLRYLHTHPGEAQRLCDAGVPVWVVHAEKGDGKLVGNEREILDECPHATVITYPGESFLLLNDKPTEVAAVIKDALAVAGNAML